MIHPHLSLDIRILDFLDKQKQTGNSEVKFKRLAEEYSEAQHVVPGNKTNLDHDGARLVPTLERLERDQLIKTPIVYTYSITELGEQKLDDIRISFT